MRSRELPKTIASRESTRNIERIGTVLSTYVCREVQSPDATLKVPNGKCSREKLPLRETVLIALL